ncbi:hypothetical protein OG21DRAFT_1485894 [Imleria badia]|nr:hypothetical protein OG21DRAFT_1485894 [Imleria badia]
MLLHSNPSSLSERLRWQTNELRSRIIRANYNTQFVQTAPELTEFRHATAGRVDGMDADILSASFQKTVHFTSYDSYAPFFARFRENPCKASAIVDLVAPGLPDYLALSSSTSGGRAKTFPKYNRLSKVTSSDAGSCAISNNLRRRTAAYVWYLACDQINVEDEANSPVTTIYLACGSIVNQRANLHLDPAKDKEKMATFILNHVAPYAVGFIKKWRSFLLIHALFAVGSRSLETMTMVFINTFVEIIHHLDMEFDMIVDCIANGTIPDLEGLAGVRYYLELNISADPDRAAELRRFGRPSSRPGWCGYVWPNLRSVTTIASGSFASSVPLFKPTNEIILEYLDISKSDSINSLAQLWEVETGGRYEVVLTTQDGLWRYRLGDVIEVSGFDPTDGIPIIQFVERRNVAIRFPDFMLTEKELRAAISSLATNVLVKVVDWTTTIDDRYFPATIGFFVELVGDKVFDFALAPQRMLDDLIRSDENIAWAFAESVIREPTIRLVRSGTFSAFRQLKLDEGSSNLGQVKVPVVLPKPAYVTWFSSRVVKEL